MSFAINLSKNPYPLKNIKAKMVGEHHDYFINKGQISSLNRGVQTENINSCTAGVLHAGKKNFLFHAAPEMQNLNTIQRELEKQVNKLQETCEKIHGFITGGWELNPKDKASVESFDLYNTIADALDHLGVEFTMICGKKKGAPMENIYTVNDNVNVWSDTFKKIDKQDLISDLEENYQFVEIPDDTRIRLLDKFTSYSVRSVG